MACSEEVIATFFGDEKFPVDWESEEEKKLHWFYDDTHCPFPISPMYADVGGWWGPTCAYMYRRFGAPFGKEWIAKVVNCYVYTTIVPRPPEEAKRIGPYYFKVMPRYATNFLQWWEERYRPEIEANLGYIDRTLASDPDLTDLMILLEDALDIQERHFKIHWILNLAQFQAFLDFRATYQEVIGEIDEDNVGKILVSTDDRNWDSLRALWELKEKVKASPVLRQAFEKDTAGPIKAELEATPEGQKFLKEIEKYQVEYGNKAIYTHEYVYPTWRENPAPILETIKAYLVADYDFPKEHAQCREQRDRAVEEMFSRVKDAAGKEKLRNALDLALRMAPLTPDHHFYIDQGTYARVRHVLMAIGRKMVEQGWLDHPEDVMMLKYNELRELFADPTQVDARALVAARRREREEARRLVPPDWLGTITHWSLYEEPYKGLWGWPEKYHRWVERREEAVVETIKGLPASPGVVEGTARVVESPAEFDRVREGDIVVCKMTNPAWVVLFTKIRGLVTDSGGVLSHPAIVSREFGIPAVTGTTVATRTISTGQRVRVDGTAGVVYILA
ncbi:MAG: PEP-utilizing enzyme [Bacillota bacterium]|nr:PEP-utilizing enzyme [Bacillota bacterium]MDI7248536.1 PEP-utilizing enzyme [Bacillota bacterium]